MHILLTQHTTPDRFAYSVYGRVLIIQNLQMNVWQLLEQPNPQWARSSQFNCRRERSVVWQILCNSYKSFFFSFFLSSPVTFAVISGLISPVDLACSVCHSILVCYNGVCGLSVHNVKQNWSEEVNSYKKSICVVFHRLCFDLATRWRWLLFLKSAEFWCWSRNIHCRIE